jgi:hypothetical protein
MIRNGNVPQFNKSGVETPLTDPISVETHPGQQALIDTSLFSLANTWVNPLISALETE